MFEADPSIRTVARDWIPGGELSTVFLGLNQAFDMTAAAVVYETMAFVVNTDHDFQVRYRTRAEALEGHRLALLQFREPIRHFMCNIVPITREKIDSMRFRVLMMRRKWRWRERIAVEIASDCWRATVDGYKQSFRDLRDIFKALWRH